jgi:hypothetical protein
VYVIAITVAMLFQEQPCKRIFKLMGKWCERLAERIYEMSVDTYSQTVMPSLHSSGWQRKHLDWEFKLANKESAELPALGRAECGVWGDLSTVRRRVQVPLTGATIHRG